ncbi:MAG: glycosyltransferase family 9 protein [Bacteroidota bacterium]
MSKTIDLTNKTVLISRTDSIGDVVLTLPTCVWIKQQFPSCKLIFLGNTYTKPVISCVSAIDKILCWKDFENLPTIEKIQKISNEKIDVCLHIFPKKEVASLMKKAKIKDRIGTSHRAFHLLTCNHRLNFSRKKSDLHEAQLNFELLKPIGLNEIPSLNEISEMLSKAFKKPQINLNPEFSELKNAVILHPKSQGSALEWPLEKYKLLAEKLLEKGKTVVFTGTENEGKLFRDFIPTQENCHDLTGKMTLEELIVFISQSESLVACSTGPLHLAGILGIKTIGLFSSRKPIHPGRWKALGTNVFPLEFDSNCEICHKGKHCSCIQKIEVDKVLEILA